MSTEGIKKNLGTIVLIVVAVAGLGYTGWKLKLALADRDEIATKLEEKQRELTSLKRYRPFPSNENVEALRDNQAVMENLYRDLRAAAARDVEVPEVDQVKFATMLGQRLSELTRQARRAKIELPASFAFGFSEYIGVLPPDDTELINDITKQLLVIARVAQLLYETETLSITSIDREPVVIPAPLMEGLDPLPDEPPALFQRMSFDLNFTTTTTGLQKFLNALTEQDWMLVVSRLQVTVNSVSYQIPIAGVAPEPSSTQPPPMPDPTMFDPRMYDALMTDPRMAAQMMTPSATPTMRTQERDDLAVQMTLELIEFPETTADNTPEQDS